jgi:hypothetical protein
MNEALSMIAQYFVDVSGKMAISSLFIVNIRRYYVDNYGALQ